MTHADPLRGCPGADYLLRADEDLLFVGDDVFLDAGGDFDTGWDLEAVGN